MASRCLTQVYKDTGIIIKCLFMIRMFVRIPFAFFFLHFKLRHLNWTLARELFLLNFPNTSYTLKPTFLKSYFREINENEIIALRKCQGHFDCQQLRQTSYIDKKDDASWIFFCGKSSKEYPSKGNFRLNEYFYIIFTDLI